LCLGCAEVRFADREILWRDSDDAPIPIPKQRESWLYAAGMHHEIFESADTVLAIDYFREAANVNALDELPTSTWWEDPQRDPANPAGPPLALDDDAMRRGPNGDEPPPEPPFVVERAKEYGATFGLVVRDARGRKFMLKADPPEWVGMATSTEAVATRLVWATGWRVPKTWLLDITRADVRLSPESKMVTSFRKEHRLGPEQFDGQMARLHYAPDGTFRAALSLWIEGKELGPYGYSGQREDDPNDRFPHEDRRDLRGLYVLSAWINNTDTQEDNTFDTYMGEPGRGHVVHYQQDVSGAFGNWAVMPQAYWTGTENYFATGRILGSLVTLGFLPRPWEGERVESARAQTLAKWPELGWFDAEHFRGTKWRPTIHNAAFDRATARDRYWGMKRLLAFDEREVRAAISVGRYRPEVAERLFDVLWRRREKLARSILGEVAALDHFRVDGGRLCFDDLWTKHGLGGESATQYAVSGGILDGKCVILPQRGPYEVVSLRVKRAGERKLGPFVKVHLKHRRIIGIER
jgi:hypothetical protein